MTSPGETTLCPSRAKKLTSILAADLLVLASMVPPFVTSTMFTVQPRTEPKDLTAEPTAGPLEPLEPLEENLKTCRYHRDQRDHLSSSGTFFCTTLAGWFSDITTRSLLLAFPCTTTWGRNTKQIQMIGIPGSCEEVLLQRVWKTISVFSTGSPIAVLII